MSDHKKATERYLPQMSNADEGYVVICACGHWASAWGWPWIDKSRDEMKSEAHAKHRHHVEEQP